MATVATSWKWRTHGNRASDFMAAGPGKKSQQERRTAKASQ